MYQESSIKIITVDKNQAEDFLKMNVFESQRPLSLKHVKKLEREINEGTFRIGEIATAVEHYNDNKKVLVNGQHQLMAIRSTGKKIKAVYEIYDVFTPGDLSLLFRKFDNNYVRTLGQKSVVEARSLGVDWPNKTISLLTSGLRYKLGDPDGKRGADFAIEELKNNLKVGDFINTLFSETDDRPYHLMRGPVVHAILLTYEKSQTDSNVFWRQVRDGEGLKKSDPSKCLRDFLLGTSVGFGRGVADVKKVSLHEMTAKCVTAWNAFRKGTNTDLKYYSTKPIPKAV